MHYDTKLKSRLKKYHFLFYPIHAFTTNIVTKSMLENPQNLIMAMQSENCIQQIKKSGADNTLRQIGTNPDLVAQCIFSKLDIISYIILSTEQMKIVIQKLSQFEYDAYGDLSIIHYILEQDRYQSLKQDHDFMIFLLKNMGDFLEYTSNEVKDNYEMVMAAVSSSASCLQWASKHLQDNKEIVMAAVSTNGYFLKWASKRLQNNKDVVIAAISSSGGALKWTSVRFAR